MSRHVAMAIACTFSALVATACGGPSTPVPVAGTSADLAALAGEWSGQYSSEQTGRSGSIVFRLTAGTDSATGDVMMSPLSGGPRSADPATPGSVFGQAQVLTIRFVRIEGGRVSGRLAPYTEPSCSCELLTVFEGRLNGAKLEGTYTSRRPDGQTQQGRWEVTRRGT